MESGFWQIQLEGDALMAGLAGPWAGRIFGTNTGKVFVDFQQDRDQLSGVLRLNDDELGIIVYSVDGKDGDDVDLVCTPKEVPENVEVEPVRISGKLMPDGTLRGKWDTQAGAGGVFQVFPHNINVDQSLTKVEEPEQINNRTVQLGSIRLFKDDVARIVEIIQKDFTLKNQIIVYEQHGNEVTKWATDFLKGIDEFSELRSLKFFIQEPGKGTVNRSVNIELLEAGDSTVRVSGPDETWVVGKAESVRKALSAYENRIVTNYRKHGLNINGFIFIGMLILMPSIPGLLRRLIFASSVIILLRILFAMHAKVIPNTLILIKAKPKGPLALAWPTILSWLLTVTSTVVAGLVFWFLTRQSS